MPPLKHVLSVSSGTVTRVEAILELLLRSTLGQHAAHLEDRLDVLITIKAPASAI